MRGRTRWNGSNTEVIFVVLQCVEGHDGMAAIEPGPGCDWHGDCERARSNQASDRATQGVPAQARSKTTCPGRCQPHGTSHQGPVSTLWRARHPRHARTAQDSLARGLQQVCGQVCWQGLLTGSLATTIDDSPTSNTRLIQRITFLTCIHCRLFLANWKDYFNICAADSLRPFKETTNV